MPITACYRAPPRDSIAAYNQRHNRWRQPAMYNHPVYRRHHLTENMEATPLMLVKTPEKSQFASHNLKCNFCTSRQNVTTSYGKGRFLAKVQRGRRQAGLLSHKVLVCHHSQTGSYYHTNQLLHPCSKKRFTLYNQTVLV